MATIMLLQALVEELHRNRPMIEKAKDLYKKLGENTKDPSTKAELKNKLAAMEKPLHEVEKKLG